MSVDLKKVSQLTRSIDVLIELDGSSTELTEESIVDYIQRAIAFTNATLSDEEYEAVKRDVSWKYLFLKVIALICNRFPNIGICAKNI